MRRLHTPGEAQELAGRLLGRLRWPVAVISISAAAAEPYIDAEKLKEEIGDLGEVVVMPTNDVSWAFSEAMPDMTQVYGGAGRVYAVDGGWRSDPYKSPLRFAYTRADSDRIVAALAKDVAVSAFRAGTAWAAAAGNGGAAGSFSLSSRSGRADPIRTGTVSGVVGDSRALVALDDGTYATIWAELTTEDVAIDQMVIRRQKVHGIRDPESRRFDVRPSLRSATTALTDYTVGTNILTRVRSLNHDALTLTLFPGVDAEVPRERITDNPHDRLEDLFTPTEVVVAHLEDLRIDVRNGTVGATLRLDTIDDEDPVAPAPALLDGGPPWLSPPVPPVPVLPAPPRRELNADHVEPGLVQPVPDSDADPEPAPVPRPTPSIGAPAGTRTAQLQELEGLARSNRALEAEIQELKRERDNLRTRLRTSGGQRRKAERAARNIDSGERADWANVFLDPDEQFRFEVQLEWARRIPAGQKAELRLPAYDIGPNFLASIADTPSIDRAKVIAVVVEVLTGLATTLDSRDVHPLRTSAAGGSAAVQRADGATCMRVALQSGTPSARRLHYWTRSKHVELSRVVLHDDMSP